LRYRLLEIEDANSVNIAELRHPETDIERAKNQEWLVMLGVCTHLGCVPLGDGNDFSLLKFILQSFSSSFVQNNFD
jgi:Rieske Fe-S protein